MRPLLALVPLFFSLGANAAVIIDAPPFVYFVGSIERTDAKRFGEIVGRNIGRKKHMVRIDSPGGDVNAAMEIGRIIRVNEMAVVIDNGATCASACVLILAAGTTKIVDPNASPVIIHRPFLATDLPNKSGYDSYYKQMLDAIKKYLGDMNIPAELADRMMSIPPHRGKRLSGADLERYMLNGDDPAYEQKADARQAHKLGISLSELNTRKAAAEETCSWPYSTGEGDLFDIASHLLCKEVILGGQPTHVVRMRVTAALRQRELIVHLRDDAQESCLRKIILVDQKASCPLR